MSSSSSTTERGRPRRIVGYHTDEENHWVAELECGHGQHVRHEPPLMTRTWVTTAEGRTSHLGTVLHCLHCLAEPCPQCGAPGAGVDCLAAFHGLLAFENENPTAFAAVHHLTVPAFHLQHPRGYRREALELWRDALGEMLDGATDAAGLRRRMGAEFAGANRVRDVNATAPEGWPTRWSSTALDAFDPERLPDVDAYIRRARRWAESVRRDLRVSAPGTDVRRP